MKKAKQKLTAEQKKKRDDKVFKILITLILTACVVLGFVKGCSNINLDLTNMDAFTLLTNNPINVQSLITDNAINVDVDKVDLAATCKPKGADFFTDDGTLDNEKWATPKTVTETIVLKDKLFGSLVNMYYNFNRIKQIDISVDSGSNYAIKIVEYVNLDNLVTNEEIRKILPSTCYTTSTYVVQANSNGQIVVNSKSVLYNELNLDKSNVITSTIKGCGTDIENNSINKFITVAEQFCSKTNTKVSFQGDNILFNI